MLRKEQSIRAELYISGSAAQQYFEMLESSTAEIEEQLQYGLKWEPLPDRKDCRISKYCDANPDDRADWDRQHAWLTETLNQLHSVFSARVKSLPAMNGVGEDGQSTNEATDVRLSV